MKTNLIFNPNGNDSKTDRLIWFGDTTNIMNLNNVRFQWASQLYQQMRDNFWIPQRTDLTNDITDYKNLTPSERRAFNGILSYLIFLDSLQTVNVPHIKLSVTAPEISLCLSEQISQEAMHSASYQCIVQTVVPEENRNDIYDFWRTDDILRKRCEFIASLYQNYVTEPTPENYFISLIADYLLESLYFYNGFVFFYTLSSRLLMGGCADIFKLINRDELSHVRLFQKLITEAMNVFPYKIEHIYGLFSEAVENEISWTNHIIGNDILGITTKSTEQYTKYLANIRLVAIGLEPLYDSVKSPYKHLEKIADVSKEGHTKSNFFETQVTSYSMSSSVDGWDF